MQVPRDRAPKHASRSRQYITYPPPHSAHFVRPEKRCFGRRAWLNRFGSPFDVTRRISACLVDREQRATLDVVPVRLEGVNDGTDDLVREKVLSSDLDDARRPPGARGEDCREVEVVRDDDEDVLVRPRQDPGVRRGRSTDSGPVDSREPVTRQPLNRAWRQLHVHEQLHGWRSGTSTSSARQAA